MKADNLAFGQNFTDKALAAHLAGPPNAFLDDPRSLEMVVNLPQPPAWRNILAASLSLPAYPVKLPGFSLEVI